jgi:hypothetical protein
VTIWGFLFVLWPFFATAAPVATPLASSGLGRVHLVELYSSESCSSCPPADAWISTLKDKPDLWKSFVPLVLHVDYWNHLGWKDGFSSAAMTKRQRDLSQTWRTHSVYTPAFVVDGKEWRGWQKGNGSFPDAPITQIALSIFKNPDGTFRVSANGLVPSKHYVIHAALLGMDRSTNVGSGENSGRQLNHNFVVLDWAEKVAKPGSPDPSFSLADKFHETGRLAISAWVEEVGSPVPLQSVGGYL